MQVLTSESSLVSSALSSKVEAMTEERRLCIDDNPSRGLGDIIKQRVQSVLDSIQGEL